MKVTVVKQFRDIKNFALLYKEGEVVEFSEARAKELQSLALVTPVNASRKAEAESDTLPLDVEPAATTKAVHRGRSKTTE